MRYAFRSESIRGHARQRPIPADHVPVVGAATAEATVTGIPITAISQEIANRLLNLQGEKSQGRAVGKASILFWKKLNPHPSATNRSHTASNVGVAGFHVALPQNQAL